MREKEIILEIKEVKNFKKDIACYSGYKIITNQQEIFLGIDNRQRCCESWGYFTTNDNIKEFENTELLNITITDTLLHSKKIEDFIDLPPSEINSLVEFNLIFVNLETSNGVLQFVAYNEHNGYYGHDAVIISKQLNHQENL